MAKRNLRDRLDNSVNAGSMADIAFLLLIFFLVTTTILNDKGIQVKLPPWDPNSNIPVVADRNIFRINVNSDNPLLVRDKPSQIDDLKSKVVNFITNPNQDLSLAIKPTKAIVSLKNDRSTSYKTYIAVYNEIKAAYNQIWDDESKRLYEISFEYCTKSQRKQIKKAFPLIISEAEPSDFASGQ